jgi:hypothetical protein
MCNSFIIKAKRVMTYNARIIVSSDIRNILKELRSKKLKTINAVIVDLLLFKTDQESYKKEIVGLGFGSTEPTIPNVPSPSRSHLRPKERLKGIKHE